MILQSRYDLISDRGIYEFTSPFLAIRVGPDRWQWFYKSPWQLPRNWVFVSYNFP